MQSLIFVRDPLLPLCHTVTSFPILLKITVYIWLDSIKFLSNHFENYYMHKHIYVEIYPKLVIKTHKYFAFTINTDLYIH